jgi:hypothetical protein
LNNNVSAEEVSRAISALQAAGIEPNQATRGDIKRVVGIGDRRARTIREWISRSSESIVAAEDDGKPKSTREDTITSDGWTINFVSDRVKNYDELVAECNIDLAIWEPERFKVKSYEVTYVPRSTRETGDDKWVRPSTKAVTVPMFAMTASFVRKTVKALNGQNSRVEFLKQFKQIIAEDKGFSFEPSAYELPDSQRNAKEIFCAAVSDLHIAEVVRSEDANGINFYNSIVCANRLWDHSQQIKQAVQERAAIRDIEKIWSPLLGDITSGSIHAEYLFTNDLTDPAAVVLGARLLRMFYAELASLGLPIEIDAVHGNHPRLTPKMPTKRQAHTNLDWQLYEFLSDGLKGLDNVRMDICTAQIGSKKLYDWTYLYEHGIGVPSGGEENFEDRLRALFDDPTYREVVKNVGASFDMVVIGNMHKPKFLERTIVNGSYIGQNELGQSWRLKAIRPQQLMWTITPDKVRDWMQAADMTHIRHERSVNPFSDYATWFLKKHGKR